MKFVKVMFLHLSVSHSVHRGGGGSLCPSMHHRSHDMGGLCPGGFLVGFCPGGSLSEAWGSLSRGSLSGGGLLGRPPYTIMGGWYVSYWNAFLLIIISFRISSCVNKALINVESVYNLALARG